MSKEHLSEDPSVLQTYWAGWWAAQPRYFEVGALQKAVEEISRTAFEAGYKCGRAEEKIGAK